MVNNLAIKQKLNCSHQQNIWIAVSSSGGEGYALNNQILGSDNEKQLAGAEGSKDPSESETNNIEKPDKEIIYTSLDEILKESLVPHLTAVYSCPYYYGEMSRLEAEGLLLNKPNGSFLLRNSSDKRRFPYSITVKQNEVIWSMRIEFYRNQVRFEDQESWMPCFESAMDLIEHYQKIPNPTLLQPVLRKIPFSLKELTKAIVSDCTTFGDVNELPIPRELHEYLRLQKLKMWLLLKQLTTPMHAFEYVYSA